VLELRLFGSMELKGEDGRSFPSVLAQPKRAALLAFLALAEPRGFHRRERLLASFWPESDESHARGSLNTALRFLRISLGSDLIPSRGDGEVGLNWDLVWCGPRAFLEMISEEDWEGALQLYRGDLLDGFHLSGCPDFQSWLDQERERYREMAAGAAWSQAHQYLKAGEVVDAERTAQRAIGHLCTDESEARCFIEALAEVGDRAAAVRFYEKLKGKLRGELELEPSAETREAVEAIRRQARPRDSRRSSTLDEPSPALPPWDAPSSSAAEKENPVFVGRKVELDVLEGWLQGVIAGKGRVGFVTGEAGSGKTALAREFCRRAAMLHPGLVVATGNCNAHTGTGDPHHPFREIVGLLTGDIEAPWAAGSLTSGHARRLWDLVPASMRALVEFGPDLVGPFISEASLFSRANTHPSVGTSELSELNRMLDRRALGSVPRQADLFNQYARVLRDLTRKGPLLLVVDDLQWADMGSASLLFELGRKLAGYPILILGLYRPSEVALGRNGQRHPLAPVVNELTGAFGEMTLELSPSGDPEFVEALVDAEPNDLGRAFRDALFQQTQGHALFTVELLRGLREWGFLVQDAKGCWVSGPELSWDRMPPRVDAVIAERIGRLPPAQRRLLTLASIEGEEFTLEAISTALGTEVQELLETVNQELAERHRLVLAAGFRQAGNQRISRFRFRHILFQRYLYQRLTEAERAYLHQEVGEALETLYAGEEQDIALQLARHFQEAGLAKKTASYLQAAAEQARRATAFPEAIHHFEAALEALLTLPPSQERDRRELELQLALGGSRYHAADTGADEACARARELATRLGDNRQLFWALSGLYVLRSVWGGDIRQGRKLSEECLALAQAEDDTHLLVFAHEVSGRAALMLGEPRRCVTHYQQLISLYDPGKHRGTHFFGRMDLGPVSHGMLGMAS